MRAALPLLMLLALSLSAVSAAAVYTIEGTVSGEAQRQLLDDVAAAGQPSALVAVPAQLLSSGTSNSTTIPPQINNTGLSSGNGTTPVSGVTQTQTLPSPTPVPLVVAPPAPPTNAFRFDCELLSNPAVFPPGDIYMTALVRSFARMQRDTGRCGYAQLSGIHGRIRSYDGMNSSRAGFCPHGTSNFVPWHRYYTCHMESCLIQQCLAEAASFTDATLRRDLETRVCHLLRMPYWQWTVNPTACRLATATIWPVRSYNGSMILAAANPWLRFNTSRRTRNTFSSTCRRTMATFIASRNQNCLFTGARTRCTANLEGCHNSCHGSIGGTMSQVATAAADPIFFLHHTFIDFLARQYEINGGSMFSPGALSPFGQAFTDVTQTTCGSRRYVYYTGRVNPYANNGGWNIPPGAVASAQVAAPEPAAAATPEMVDGLVVEPSAAAARTQLDGVMQSLVGGYTGYTWNLQVPEVHCKQTRTAWTMVAVLRGTRLPRKGRAVDMAALTTLPGYCDQYYSFSCVDPMVNAPYVDATFDLTQCLAASGLQPDRAPKDPSHPLLGPGSVPITLKDVQLVVLDGAKRPMGRRFKLPSGTSLSWSYVYNTAAMSRDATTSQAAVVAAAAAAGSGGWGLVGGTVESTIATTAPAGTP